MKTIKKVKVLPDGPYEITGGVSLNRLQYVPDKHGASIDYKLVENYPLQQEYHLCRCGKSQNTPFCDGSHTQGFNGKETASHETYEEMAELLEGELLDLLDAKVYCSIARFCDTHGDTWTLVTEGTNDKEKDIAIEQCKHCPSGRLTAVTKKGEKIEPELPQEISILEDPAAKVHGPIWVKGGILIEDANGKAYPVRNRVTLCRCGKSQNKPFCDGKHMK